MAMNQKYHVVFKNGGITVRRPWKGKDVELYSSSGAVRDGVVIPAMFGEHEKRQFLELLDQPFIVVTIDIPKQRKKDPLKGGQPDTVEAYDDRESPEIVALRKIIGDGHRNPGNGLEVTDPDTGEKSQWQVAGYYVRDEGAILIMVAGDQTRKMYDLDFFRKLGLHLELGDNWGNTFKVGKYLKRLYSHHRKFGSDTIIKTDEDGTRLTVRKANGAEYVVKYRDYGALTEGMAVFASPRFMKLNGMKAVPGLGLRWTSLGPEFTKGYGMVKPGLQYDLVLYNSKKLLRGDKFTYGFDLVKGAGAVYTDIQSYINFRLNDLKFLTHNSIAFMFEVDAALKDEEKLREMLRFYQVGFHITKDADGDEVFVEKTKDWAIMRALRAGVSHTKHPALVRQMFNLFTRTIMNCETNLRAPIQANIGSARYAMVDPSIFDMWGEPVLEGELHGNQVYCGGKIGDIAYHRQPSAHRGECYVSNAVTSQFLSTMDTGTYMFLSRDVGAEAMAKLGGGDYDDRLVYYTDQEVVNHFKQLALDPYPVERPEAKPVVEKKVNFFSALKIRPMPVYDRKRLLEMADQIKKQHLSIGQVVNALMLDTVITDHRRELLAYIVTSLPKDQKVNHAITWLEQYPGYVLRGVAGQLELVIDAVKKEGADLQPIVDQIRSFNATFAVVPEFYTRGGRYEGRVPQSRRGENYPVVSSCTIDEELLDIHGKRLDLEDVVIDNSWQAVEPIPEEMLVYPTLPGSQQLAVAMRQFYFTERAKFEGKIPRTHDEREARAVIDAYKRIDEALVTNYGNHPLMLDAMIYLYIMVYDNRRPEAPRTATGMPKPFPDGMLWGPRMSHFTIKMLERVGLAGRYVPVDFDPEARKYKRQVIVVDVEQGVVVKQDTHEVLGHVNPMADGKNRLLERGLIKVSASEAYPYEPEPRWMLLTVLAGWGAKTDAARRMAAEAGIPVSDMLLDIEKQIREWRAQENKEVELIPYIYVDETTGQSEHAVRVMLEGQEYGNISREDSVYITMPTKGWLMKGDTPMSMKVIVRDFSVRQ